MIERNSVVMMLGVVVDGHDSQNVDVRLSADGVSVDRHVLVHEMYCQAVPGGSRTAILAEDVVTMTRTASRELQDAAERGKAAEARMGRVAEMLRDKDDKASKALLVELLG